MSLSLARLAEIFLRSVAEGPARFVELAQQLLGRQPGGAPGRADNRVALVGVHEAGGVEQTRHVFVSNSKETVLIRVDQLAGLDPLTEDFHRATPTHRPTPSMSDAEATGQSLEPGVGHFVHVTDGAISDGADAAERAVRVAVYFAPERTDD